MARGIAKQIILTLPVIVVEPAWLQTYHHAKHTAQAQPDTATENVFIIQAITKHLLQPARVIVALAKHLTKQNHFTAQWVGAN